MVIPWRIKRVIFKYVPKIVRDIYFSSQRNSSVDGWFSKAKPEFQKFLTPLSGQNVNFLQIGAFAGDASFWMLKEVLTNTDSQLFDVDTWEGSEEHIDLKKKFDQIEAAYDAKVISFTNVVKNKMTSDDFFAINRIKFDFIYIDGDHSSYQVAIDAENALKVCQVGGIIAFDDYGWEGMKYEVSRPKQAVDKFLKTHEKRLIVLHKQYQVWVRVMSAS